MRLSRFFIRQFAEEPEDGRGKVVFYMGPGTDQQKQDVLQEVFPSMERDGAPRLIAYNGGFDTFAAECLHTRQVQNALKRAVGGRCLLRGQLGKLHRPEAG